MATVEAADHRTQYSALLRDMYKRDLVTVDIPRLASYLAIEGVISQDHAATVANCRDKDRQLGQLCDYLVATGNSKFSSNRHLIRTFNTSHASQDQTSCEQGHEVEEGRPPLQMAVFAGIQYTFLKQLYHSHYSSSTVQHRLKWLNVDIENESSIESHFPSSLVQDLCSDETSISLTSLLRATKQLLHYCMKHCNTSSSQEQQPTAGDAEQLRKELARSQKEYARITQLWEEQCQQLQNENAALKCRLDEAETRSSKQLHQQIQDSSATLNAEIAALKKELEEDKNYIEELKDQVANYKLNAKLKEPTAREFAHVLESKRHLEARLEELTSSNQCLEARNQSLEKEMASLQEEVAVLCEGRKTMLNEMRESNDRILALKLHLNGSNGSNKDHYSVRRETQNSTTVYGTMDKQCPACQQVFHTLSDGEFTCHVAGCFK